MIRKTLLRNKAKFIEYNGFRKELFLEYSPRDSEFILYLLPWLLSVNHPSCPGYIKDQENPFTVCHIADDKQIKNSEESFKEMFGISERGSFLLPVSEGKPIEGLYTIGSVGTISQTFDSDCDIWVCYDSKKIGRYLVSVLNTKIRQIGAWLEKNCRIPVHFFVLDIDDIVNCRFGTVDDQSSGSTQTHVLKEEFYRTCVVICGKLPLWWVCYDPKKELG
jgi:adenylate cyclase class 1